MSRSYEDKVSDLLGGLSPGMRAMTVENFALGFNGRGLGREERVMAEAIFRASLRDKSHDVRRAMSE